MKKLTLLVAAVLALLVAALPAGAQEENPLPSEPIVLQVDATDAEMSLVIRADASPDVDAKVNGADAEGLSTIPISADSRVPQVAIVLDTSETTDDDVDARDAVRSAAASLTSTIRQGEEMAVVSTGGRSEVEQGFTSDSARLTSVVTEGSAAGGRNAVWETVSRAAKLFEDDRAINDIVVFVGSADEASDVTSVTARGDAITASARVHVIAFGDHTNEESLAELATATGGSFQKTARVDEAVEAAEALRSEFDNTFVTQFTTTGVDEGSKLVLTIDGQTQDLGYISGSVSTGKMLEPIEAASTSSGFLTGTTALVIGVILIAVAIGLFVYATGSLVGDDASLNSVLQPYAEDGPVSGRSDDSALMNSAIFQRAVEMTENIAENRGILERVEGMLERADMPLRAAEALTFYFGIVVITALGGLLVGGSPIAALVALVLGAILPPAFVNFRASRRRKAFLSQLPTTLQLLSSTLKAGYSFMQGVEATSHEVDDPMGEELRRVVSEAQLGRPLEDALEASADRMGSPDFEWAILAVRIQREVGGNLAELLLTVAETMQARERLRREVNALTAEGRISAIVLGILPIGLGFAMWAINPDYISTLFTETVGNFMLGGSIVLAGLGFAWMKKIVDIEI